MHQMADSMDGFASCCRPLVVSPFMGAGHLNQAAPGSGLALNDLSGVTPVAANLDAVNRANANGKFHENDDLQ